MAYKLRHEYRDLNEAHRISRFCEVDHPRGRFDSFLERDIQKNFELHKVFPQSVSEDDRLLVNLIGIKISDDSE